VGSGIAGYQIEDVLRDLVRSAKDIIEAEGRPRQPNDDIELARRGIIFFDEFDKISTAELSAYYVSEHLSVQRRLLKLVEGAVLPVGVRQHVVVEEDDERTIDTSGILVLAGGAFADIKSSSIRTRRPEALARELTKLGLSHTIVSADINTYGFMPELVARLPILVEFNDLNDEDLRSILNNSLISPTQVWAQHFEQLGKKLIITDDAYNYVVKRALMLKMGARGLHQVLFPALAKLTYDIEVVEGTEFIVNAELLMRAEMQSREERLNDGK
jgi:ATP-dependent Clp protease ATP-binding subunit ClpX